MKTRGFIACFWIGVLGLGCAASNTAGAPAESASRAADDREVSHTATSAPAADERLVADAVAPAPMRMVEPSVSSAAAGGSPGAKERPPRSDTAKTKKGAADFGGGEGHGVAEGGRPEVAPRAAPVAAPIAAPAMRAGRHDDNRQYNRFLQFLADNDDAQVYPVNISERLVIRTVDKDGRSLPSCAVEVKDAGGKTVATAVTYADGKTQLFPADVSDPAVKDYAIRATCGKETKNGQLPRFGKRETELRFSAARVVSKPVPVDIAIVLDTTGSMQSQIDRLKSTLKAIHFQLTQLPMQPDIRFALVAYRDRGDDYVTKVQDFTADVGRFQSVLAGLEADGGGDTPEDLQKALDDGMHKLSWRDAAVRVGFMISDAPPHTDYGQEYNYREAMREALRRGIKWVAVGAGGLDRQGEVIFRQVAQFTFGEYVFITEGGGGDAEGGVGEASHHVGSNYSTENLDQAIVRIVRRELSYLTDAPKDFDDTIVATAAAGVAKEQVLVPAVNEVLRQLVDYSAIKLADGTPVAIVPTAADKGPKDVAEYLGDQMTLAASRSSAFKVVERDLGAVAQEMKLQLSELFDVKDSVPIGKLVGAEVMIVSKLAVRPDGASLFAKLLRVETGEVLSVANVEFAATVLSGS
ncbi:MAG: VWA domain-containing protein [Deltaproteobacteria bacterium]|nr:VWA domain-containing protein [Deltaproteobacteria bacterium]